MAAGGPEPAHAGTPPGAFNDIPGVRENARLLVERIDKVLPLTPRLTALDFGAGTGLVTLRLLPKIGLVHALDPSAEMLALLRSAVADAGFSNCEIVNGVITDFRALPVDFVVCSASLHHTPDPWEAIRLSFPAVKPGGWIFIVEAREKLDLDALPEQLRTVGFTDVASEDHVTIEFAPPGGRPVSVKTVLFSARRPAE
jgi:ubiquinone/menaquinone biosynthesis C-methylase UbiE